MGECSCSEISIPVKDYADMIMALQKIKDIQSICLSNIDLLEDATRGAYILKCIGSIVDVVSVDDVL